MATKRTPGPWTFESFSFGPPGAAISHKKIVGPKLDGISQKLIAEVHMEHPTHEADGQLLAAAPELLDAVETALAFFYNPTSFNPLDVERKFQFAIRKADGLSTRGEGT